MTWDGTHRPGCMTAARCDCGMIQAPPPSETGATAEAVARRLAATANDEGWNADSAFFLPFLTELVRSAHLEDARALRNRAASAKSMIDGGDRYWLGWVEGQHDAVAAILGVCQTCLHEAHPERYCEHTNGHVCGCPGDALSLTGAK